MLTIDNNWKREQEIDATAYPNMIMDYREKYNVFPRQFRGETFDVKVIFAAEKDIKYQSKSGESNEATILEITVLLKNPDDGKVYFFTGSIFSSKSYQSNDLHDFLMLCIGQNPNALSQPISRVNYGKSETLYPNICGCRFKVNIATTGFNKGGYEKQSWKFYNTLGFSQEEIENGITSPQAITSNLQWLQDKYQKFQSEIFKPQTNVYDQGNSQTNSAYQSKTSVSSWKSSQPKDDLPF